jgi:hypothetical protein
MRHFNNIIDILTTWINVAASKPPISTSHASEVTLSTGSLEVVQLLSNLLDPTAVDQLVKVQSSSAVRALVPLLGQPPSYAGVAAKLGAVRAEVGVDELLHADEAPEHLCQALRSTKKKKRFRAR